MLKIIWTDIKQIIKDALDPLLTALMSIIAIIPFYVVLCLFILGRPIEWWVAWRKQVGHP